MPRGVELPPELAAAVEAQAKAAMAEHTADLEYLGQSLATCVKLALQTLLKQKRRQPTQEERRSVYRRQDGCPHCTGELDIETEEFDHLLPVRDAVAGQQEPRDVAKPNSRQAQMERAGSRE